MKILKISMLALGTSLCGVAQADVVGVKADASFWNYDGQANMAAQTALDDQDLDRKGAAQISVAIEHPVPLIPNAKIRYVNLKTQTKMKSRDNLFMTWTSTMPISSYIMKF